MSKTTTAWRVVDSPMQYCPLLEREIDDGYCYEINSVVAGLCNPSLINNVVTKEEATAVCNSCENSVW